MSTTSVNQQTDLDLMKAYITDPHPDPVKFRELERRGLIPFVNHCPGGEAGMAVLYSRLAKAKKIVGDPQIDQIAGQIGLMERYQNKLCRMKVTEIDNLIEHLDDMKAVAIEIQNYFKQ